MSGLLQRLAHRAVSGEAGLTVRPSLAPRFAPVAVETGVGVGESFDFETAPHSQRVSRPRSIDEPVDAAAPPGAPAAHSPNALAPPPLDVAHVAQRAEGSQDSRSFASLRMTAAKIRMTAETARMTAETARTMAETAAQPAEQVEQSATPVVDRLGWPTRTARVVEAEDFSAPRRSPAVTGAEAEETPVRSREEPSPTLRTIVERVNGPTTTPVVPDAGVRTIETSAEERASPRPRARAESRNEPAVAGARESRPREDGQRPLSTAPAIARAENRPAGERVAESGPPTINVTIGRIDVRAVPQSPTPAPAAPRSPRLTLDQFLAQRSGRGR